MEPSVVTQAVGVWLEVQGDWTFEPTQRAGKQQFSVSSVSSGLLLLLWEKSRCKMALNTNDVIRVMWN